MNFGKFDTFIFDLDGTVWCWEKLYPGVKRTLNGILADGKQIIFASNNTALSRKGLVEKLNGFGVEAETKNMINAGYATALYLKKVDGKAEVLAFGKGLREELKFNKINLVGRTDPDFLVVGHDLEFNMKKLSMAFEALGNGAKFLGTARGNIFTTEKRTLPGTGLVVGLVESMSGKKAKIIGKPSDFMCKMIRGMIKSKMERTLLVGDELDSDIVVGKKLGCYTCLVKTGVKNKTDGWIKPDFVIDSVADIVV